MPGFIGFWELLALAAVVLLLFGPKRLPEIGRSLGRGMREFKESVTAPLEDAQWAEEDQSEMIDAASLATGTDGAPTSPRAAAGGMPGAASEKSAARARAGSRRARRR